MISVDTTITELKSPSTASFAIAPGSIKEVPASHKMDASPLSVITGAVLSTTVTSRVAEASFPAASFNENTTEYTPGIEISTLLKTVIFELISPSTLSFPIAPTSSYSSPAIISTSESPIRTNSGAVWSVTFTVLVTVKALFPLASVELYVIKFTPILLKSTDPEVII